jgi:cytochrome c-type biogenesis protein CcmH
MLKYVYASTADRSERKIMKHYLAVIITLAAVFLFFGKGAAQNGIISDDEVNAVAKQIYCPVCENTPLDVCPTQVCAQWRELIREQIGMGWSEAEIKQYFVVNYGDRVLAMPPAQSPLNQLFYILPVAAIAAGMFVLFRAFRSWQKPVQVSQTESTPAPGSDDAYIQRLEEELRKR